MQRIFRDLRRAFHDPRSEAYRRIDVAVWVLIVLSVALTVLEVSRPDLAVAWSEGLQVLETGILVVFVVELVLRVATWESPDVHLFELTPRERVRRAILGRIGFLLQPMQVIDVLAVLPAIDPALRGLRALRALRLLRSFRVFRFANPFEQIWGAFKDNALLYVFAFGFLAVETVVGGITVYQIERGSGSGIDSPFDGMWWTLVTLTTVGYGDLTPTTDVGRIWAGVLMVMGMFTLALFAGIIGHTLLNTVLTIREEQFRMSSYAQHVIVCGYDAGSRLLLDALLEEGEDAGTEIVVMAAGERPPDIPAAFRWVQGDPTKEAEFDKVRLTHASAVVVVGERGTSPQAADARTILTLFTIRRYMQVRQESVRRRRDLHLVAEVLDTENVDHARAAGADEVIASARIGFSLLAHTVVQPGTGELLARVVAKGDHSVFIADGRPFVGQTFGAVQRSLKDDHGALLLGLRRTTDSVERMNVPDGTVIGHDEVLVYLHTSGVLPEPHDPREPA